MNTLAIDIGGTKISAALINEHNQIIQHHQLMTPASASPTELTSALETLISPLKSQAQQIAVASTGIISEGTLTALNPDNLGGLNNFPLLNVLQYLSGLPCWVLNDAQAAAWAEFDWRSDEINDMAFITVSTGVGGGLVLNRQLMIGKRGIVGHLGHTLADPHGPRCGCGRIGCVEAIASGRGIAAQAQGELAGNDARAIFSAYYDGNQQARTLIERSAQTIARLAIDIKAAVDVDCIVLGGSVGLADGYLELIQKEIALAPHILQPPIVKAHFNHDAGLWGATFWAREQA